jgi:hypothetical protein
MHLLRGIVLILLRPATFIREATAHAVAAELRENEQVRAKWPNGPLPEKLRLELESTVKNQTDSIRRALFTGLGITILTMYFGYAAGVASSSTFGPPSKALVYLLQAIGAGLVLGATLGEIGREIQTWDRRSLPERINTFIFRSLYVIGTFMFVGSVAWDAA